MDKNKIYNPTDYEIRKYFIEAIKRGHNALELIEEKPELLKYVDDDGIEHEYEIDPLHTLYSELDISTLNINGFGSNTFALMCRRLKDAEDIKIALAEELQLIEETYDLTKYTVIFEIFCAAAIPPLEEFQIESVISIYPPTDGQRKYYEKLVGSLKDVNPNLSHLSILKFEYSYDISDQPRAYISIGGGEDGPKGEIITNTIMNESDYYKQLQQYFQILTSSFKLAGGDFIPIYRIETNANPYTPGYKPIQYKLGDLYANGIDFTNEEVLRRLNKYFETLKELIVVQKNKQIEIATNRLLGFFSPYKSADDKFIDGMILVEALILADARGELANRAAQRVATLLAHDEKMRMYAFRLMKNAYNYRSKIVHGGIEEKKQKIPKLQEFFVICQAIYLNCLQLYDKRKFSQNEEITHFTQIMIQVDEFILSEKTQNLKDFLKIKYDEVILHKIEKPDEAKTSKPTQGEKVYFR